MKIKPAFWKQALSLLGMLLLALVSADVFGRPGGGSGFSGGGGGGGGFSGGGGGGGDGEGIGMLVYLIIRYPHITIPIIIIVVVVRVIRNRNKPKQAITSAPPPVEKTGRVRAVRQQLTAYQQEDPNFSTTLFLDFVQHLYYQVQSLRGKPAFSNLKPYINPGFFPALQDTHGQPMEITEIVIGTADAVHFERTAGETTITVELETNYTLATGGHTSRIWSVERWVFSRKAGVLSKGPEAMQNPGCPNCGSPLETNQSGECVHCSTVVVPGTLTWELATIRRVKYEQQPAMSFDGYVEEQGTDLPTMVDPTLNADTQEFLRRHNLENQAGAYWETLRTRVFEAIFREIYAGWAENNWERLRPLLTDHLFRSYYWLIQQYKSKGLTNKLDNLQITKVQPVQLLMDKYYESMTVRIYANVKDYTVNEKGAVIGGSSTRPRHFSEYWTFIRRAGVEKSEKDFNPSSCPNCGAPVNMGMSGVCGSCGAKVTTGEFGWVLSRITQDDVYAG